jgi:two-component system chemotaxis response regulator CheY
MKILIVDDSSLSRRTLRHILEQNGHSVEEASDGSQAIERYFIHHPELVFLDMVMEGMYGLEVLAKIRELDPKAKVIVATADIQESTREMAQSAGAVALINKPLKADAVVTALSAINEKGSAWS